MTRFTAHPSIEASVSVRLTESEFRALYALTSYGADQFLKRFYEMLGDEYLKKHEKGLRSLFDAVLADGPEFVNACDAARVVFQKTL